MIALSPRDVIAALASVMLTLTLLDIINAIQAYICAAQAGLLP